jgi:hypothetical protein
MTHPAGPPRSPDDVRELEGAGVTDRLCLAPKARHVSVADLRAKCSFFSLLMDFACSETLSKRRLGTAVLR